MTSDIAKINTKEKQNKTLGVSGAEMHGRNEIEERDYTGKNENWVVW